jgi:hypothetical protein
VFNSSDSDPPLTNRNCRSRAARAAFQKGRHEVIASVRGPQPGLVTPAETGVLFPPRVKGGGPRRKEEAAGETAGAAAQEVRESRVVAVEGLWRGDLAKSDRDRVFESLMEACGPFGRVVDLVLPSKGSLAYCLYSGVEEARSAREALNDGGKGGLLARLVGEDEFSLLRQQDLTVTSDMNELD